MAKFTHPDPGIELDWLGIDIHGHVALFSSGGDGPIPRIVWDHFAEVDTALEHLNNLPIIGSCSKSKWGVRSNDDWTEAARRGLFTYDWEPGSDGPYARLTVPSRAITVDELSDAGVQNAARLVRLTVDFAKAAHIDSDMMGVELYNEPYQAREYLKVERNGTTAEWNSYVEQLREQGWMLAAKTIQTRPPRSETWEFMRPNWYKKLHPKT